MIVKELFEATDTRIYVAFFLLSWGERAEFVEHVGVFNNINEATVKVRQYMIEKFRSQAQQLLDELVNDPNVSEEDIKDVTNTLKRDTATIRRWTFREYTNDRGVKLFEMGEGEVILSGKIGSYPTENDVNDADASKAGNTVH